MLLDAQHRHVGQMQDLGGHRTHDHVRQGAHAANTHDKLVTFLVLGIANDDIGYLADADVKHVLDACGVQFRACRLQCDDTLYVPPCPGQARN